MSPEAGLARLDEIEASPDPYGNTLTVIAFALTSGAVARFLGGGLREIGVGVAIGIVTGLLALLARQGEAAGRRLTNPWPPAPPPSSPVC